MNKLNSKLRVELLREIHGCDQTDIDAPDCEHLLNVFGSLIARELYKDTLDPDENENLAIWLSPEGYL